MRQRSTAADTSRGSYERSAIIQWLRRHDSVSLSSVPVKCRVLFLSFSGLCPLSPRRGQLCLALSCLSAVLLLPPPLFIRPKCCVESRLQSRPQLGMRRACLVPRADSPYLACRACAWACSRPRATCRWGARPSSPTSPSRPSLPTSSRRDAGYPPCSAAAAGMRGCAQSIGEEQGRRGARRSRLEEAQGGAGSKRRDARPAAGRVRGSREPAASQSRAKAAAGATTRGGRRWHVARGCKAGAAGGAVGSLCWTWRRRIILQKMLTAAVLGGA